MKFDSYEWQILQALQQNGQITNHELADKVGLSATPCWRRLNELGQSGVIKKHVALLDPKLVGIKEVVFAYVTLNQQSGQWAIGFEEAINNCSKVMECYASMGDADYLLKVAVPDIAAYDHFLQSFLMKLPGVMQVRSSFALRAVKQDTALPLDVYNHKKD